MGEGKCNFKRHLCNMIRLGIIEDDPTILSTLTNFFSVEPAFRVVLAAGSVEQFLEEWEKDMHFDVIISDIGLPGETGIQGLPRLKKREPNCNVMMLTVYNDSNRIFQALCSGATGYLLKQTPLLKIKEAVISLYEGGSPMSPAIARKIVEHFNPKKTGAREKLTPRELQIVQAVELGLTNKEVAVRLDISLETVKSHVKNIYQKLEVNSRHSIIKGLYR